MVGLDVRQLAKLQKISFFESNNHKIGKCAVLKTVLKNSVM